MISRLRTPLALFAIALLAGCATQDTHDTNTAAYAVNLTGATAELDHPNYDPQLGGYWLVGSAATMQFSQIRGQSVPETFTFMLRTKADASAANPSQLDLFKIISPRYTIVTRYNAGTPVPVDIITPKADVLVKSDSTGRYVKFERVGERIKVTITKECLTQLIGTDAVISWVDKQSAPKRTGLEAEEWRRVFKETPTAR